VRDTCAHRPRVVWPLARRKSQTLRRPASSTTGERDSASVGEQSLLFGVFAKLFTIGEGIKPPDPRMNRQGLR
jgi:hypothetical protein